MKNIFLVCFIYLCTSSLIAHEVNEAFFTFIQKKNTIEVNAEFPWTMRNALIKFNPSLNKSTDKKDFENTFIKYIQANLIIKDKNGDLIKFIKFLELDNNGHSHQNNYLIIFEGTDLFEVTNTVMFNLYDNQVNYNSVTINSNTKIFETTKGLTYFKTKNNSFLRYLFVPLVLIVLFYIVYRFRNKNYRKSPK